MPKGVRYGSMLLLDAFLTNLAVYIMLLLRFEGSIPIQYIAAFKSLIPLFSLSTIAFLLALKLYNRVWEYASLGEMFAIIRAATFSMVFSVLLIYLFNLPNLPRSVYIGSWILVIALIGASRVWWRVFRDFWLKNKGTEMRRVLVVGGGDAGAMLVKETQNNPHLHINVVAIVDDAPRKQKMILNNIPILGARKHIPNLVRELEVDEIIIAMPSVSADVIRDTVEICKKTRAKVRILPGIYQSAGSLVRNVRDIEMEDLLRRKPIEVDLNAISGYISDKVVLVTGGGGSIGSELCRQIASFKPGKLVILDYNENNLYDIEMELRGSNLTTIWTELVDVKNRKKLEEVYRFHRPQVVFHAAAFKHVPMMERHPDEALFNNVVGSCNTAILADKYSAEIFILISTDKAVNPSSIMGASKRVAELVIKDINRNSKTRFAAVRFGNVLGSRGSVVPLFTRQIRQGGPVTVTHPEMKRYFMTIPEAVQLVIQAGSMAEGGDIFVLDMGDPVKIDDLARDLIRLSGYEPDQDIQIKYTGIRPGEKLFEELFTGSEGVLSTRHERIFICNKELDSHYIDIASSVGLYIKNRINGREEAISFITSLLPEYHKEVAATVVIDDMENNAEISVKSVAASSNFF